MDANEGTPGHRRRIPLPTTFGGVAALAQGPGRWLAAWQVSVALITAVVVAWAFDVTWGSAIERAIPALPDVAAIRSGRLVWPDREPRVLAQGPFLAIAVDPSGTRNTGLTSDVTVAIEDGRLAVRSVAGWTSVPIPPSVNLGLSRVQLSGTLAAWRGPVLGILAALTFAGLLAAWTAMATVYSSVLWALSGPLGRDVPWGTCWRLAAASLLSGAILVIVTVPLYATEQVGLTGFLVAVALHLVVGWIFCAAGWTRLRLGGIASGNPFSHGREAKRAAARARSNPFQPR